MANRILGFRTIVLDGEQEKEYYRFHKSFKVPVVGLAELKEWIGKEKRVIMLDSHNNFAKEGYALALANLWAWAEGRSKGETK